MNKPEWLLDIPSEQYHEATKRGEYTTSHRLNLFRKCPLAYKQTIDGIMKEGDTAAFAFGRAVHTYILEGREKYDAEYMTSDGPTNEKIGRPYGKSTKAYAEWEAEQTKPVVSTEDFALIDAMRTAVHSHPVALDILQCGVAEATIRTTWNGESVQCRMDWFDFERNIIADLKTCADVDRFGFDIRDFGYVTQLAFYAKCVMLARGDDPADLSLCPKCYLVAVEKKEPYRVAVAEICALTIGDANDSSVATKWGAPNGATIRELQECRRSDIWPTRYEQVQVL